MRTRLSKLCAAAGVLATLTWALPAFAVDIIDDPAQIDERAAQLVQASNSLCWEMHRFHQQQPDYRQAYRSAKEIWSRAGELRTALRSGPVETEVLTRQVTEFNEIFTQVEKTVSTWGAGDRSLVGPNGGPGRQTVVNQGAEIDLPFIGFRVGGPQVVVTEDGPPQLARRRLHPNSRGSQRSLERELAAARVAINYLLEDVGVTDQPISKTPPRTPAATGPVPQPPAPDAAGRDVQKIGPPSTKSSGNESLRK